MDQTSALIPTVAAEIEAITGDGMTHSRRRRILLAAAFLLIVGGGYSLLTPAVDQRFVGTWRLTPVKPPGGTITLEIYRTGRGRRIVGGTAAHRTGEFRWWVVDEQLVVQMLSGTRWQIAQKQFRYAYARLRGQTFSDFAQCTILSVSPDMIELDEGTLQRVPQ